MVWSWKKIKDEWLQDGRIAVSKKAVVEAFNVVEQQFGTEWSGWRQT